MEEIEYKSEAYYKSINSLSFTPVQIVDVKVKHLKGELISRKKIFGITYGVKYATEDLYKIDGCYGLYNKKEYARYYRLSIDKNGNFIRRAKVHVGIPNNSTDFRFDTDEEAIDFINNIKNKCQICGNRLM